MFNRKNETRIAEEGERVEEYERRFALLGKKKRLEAANKKLREKNLRDRGKG